MLNSQSFIYIVIARLLGIFSTAEASKRKKSLWLSPPILLKIQTPHRRADLGYAR